MRVLFAFGEVAYIHKTGGLGDVGFELPDALSKLEVQTEIIMPRFHSLAIPPGWRHEFTGDILYRDDRLTFKLISGLHPKNQRIKVYLIDEPLYISSNQLDDAKRYGVYSLAISSWLKRSGQKFDVVHAHDWHSALLPLIMKRDQIYCPSILTIHNLLFQGIAPRHIADELHLPTSWEDLSWDLGNGDINFMLEGILYADQITTVSPTYALEIQSPTNGGGLHDVLRNKSYKLTGILNGISWQNWDPAIDTEIPSKFNVETWQEGKLAAREVLQASLKINNFKILLGYVGRADSMQKGIQLILELVEKNWNPEWHVVMLAQGDTRLEQSMREAEAKNPEKITVVNRFDEKLARLIYSASDLMLIPSKYEPCGLVQLIAMRYGSIPIVRQTGGLADTVFDNVNGFVFQDYSAEALRITLNRAIKEWLKEKTRLVQTAMTYDSSWQVSSNKYKQLYEKLILK